MIPTMKVKTIHRDSTTGKHCDKGWSIYYSNISPDIIFFRDILELLYSPLLSSSISLIFLPSMPRFSLIILTRLCDYCSHWYQSDNLYCSYEWFLDLSQAPSKFWRMIHGNFYIKSGGKIAGAIIGALAGIALIIAGYIYCKSVKSKKGKPLSKNNSDYQEDEMDTL